MLRTPDIPVREKKEFSKEEFEEEKLWLQRKAEGKIFTSTTSGGWILALGASALVSLFIGGIIGGFVAIVIGQAWIFAMSLFITFVFSIYFLKGDYSRLEVDPERGLILYEGMISFGGELRSTRFRHSYKILEGSLLVRFKRFSVFKSRPFVRFVTKSGYLRINFNPDTESEFLESLQQLSLVDIDAMVDALTKQPVRTGEGYLVYYEKKFDRKAFFAELKRQREEKEHQERIEKRIKRNKLIEKSKQVSQSQSPVEEDQSQESGDTTEQ